MFSVLICEHLGFFNHVFNKTFRTTLCYNFWKLAKTIWTFSNIVGHVTYSFRMESQTFFRRIRNSCRTKYKWFSEWLIKDVMKGIKIFTDTLCIRDNGLAIWINHKPTLYFFADFQGSTRSLGERFFEILIKNIFLHSLLRHKKVSSPHFNINHYLSWVLINTSSRTKQKINLCKPPSHYSFLALVLRH